MRTTTCRSSVLAALVSAGMTLAPPLAGAQGRSDSTTRPVVAVNADRLRASSKPRNADEWLLEDLFRQRPFVARVSASPPVAGAAGAGSRPRRRARNAAVRVAYGDVRIAAAGSPGDSSVARTVFYPGALSATEAADESSAEGSSRTTVAARDPHLGVRASTTSPHRTSSRSLHWRRRGRFSLGSTLPASREPQATGFVMQITSSSPRRADKRRCVVRGSSSLVSGPCSRETDGSSSRPESSSCSSRRTAVGAASAAWQHGLDTSDRASSFSRSARYCGRVGAGDA